MNDRTRERINNLDFMLDSYKNALVFYLKHVLDNNKYENSEELVGKFAWAHNTLLKEQEKKEDNKLDRLNKYITQLKPALDTILEPGKVYDDVCDAWIASLNIPLDRIRRQINDKKHEKSKKKPSFDLRYVCTVCNETLEIPKEIKKQIEAGAENIDLPKHHDKQMIIKIQKIEEKEDENAEPFEHIIIHSAEHLMSHSASSTFTETKSEYLKILSVGIDIGSSTSHLIFSRLTLKRERSFFNMTNRFMPKNREIIYEGNIIFTPLIDQSTIDIEAVVKFCQEEYEKAGIKPEEVDTGAVIVTGETAKKQNAAEIVNRVSSESGKFVSAAAGPNFESLLGAMGSGVVEQSLEKQRTILNVDAGGGTSNMAIASKGDIISTGCINVGGRLLGIDKNFKIWRIDEPTVHVMKELNMNYQLEDIIPESDVKIIANAYANALLEVMRGPATSPIAKMLMMTDNLDFAIPIDEISFSGGIGEMIYGDDKTSNDYNDIGNYLAREIKTLVKEFKMPLIEPKNKIRATVIGAGAYSLSVSGSTCFFDKGIALPINNIPVIPVNIKKEDICDAVKDEINSPIVKKEIMRAYKNYDFEEGKDVVALYFSDPIYNSARWIPKFAKAIEHSLPQSVANNKIILLIFKGDIAKLLGLAIRKETAIQDNLICLDELLLEAGDWIDIGAPLKSGGTFGAHLESAEAFPVTVKSLVFNKDDKK